MEPNYSSGLNEKDSTVSNTVTGSAYDPMSSSTQASASKMRSELSNLKRDLDDLMSRATSMSDMDLNAARNLLMEKYSSMQQSVKGIASEAGKQFSHGADLTSDYVKERPLQSVAIATGIGLLLGAILRRR
ncbi:MAG: hypothetical protein A3I66_22275 [Burkholderiales bacterium RIFCSPLOWO2_02_FULL_57_36]|nr:MAG: hypothetical protein A3I66_22275 [Burkholderiales bacterium RIFCSPLOWO2_02_FULL_57_36]